VNGIADQFVSELIPEALHDEGVVLFFYINGLVQVNGISMQFIVVFRFGGFYRDVAHLLAGVAQAQA
jgi:hypothetical protein